jgi:hypothetical protein
MAVGIQPVHDRLDAHGGGPTLAFGGQAKHKTNLLGLDKVNV